MDEHSDDKRVVMTVQELTISVKWSPAEEEAGVPYSFPHPFTPYFRSHYKVPAIYRWRVTPSVPKERELVYIGEAEDLHRRVQRVLTPSKKEKVGDTNFRLHQLFEAFVAQGARVLLEIATFGDFKVNGLLFSPSTVGNEFVRCAVESMLVRLAHNDNAELLNKRMSERHAQKVRGYLNTLPAGERPRVIQDWLLEVQRGAIKS